MIQLNFKDTKSLQMMLGLAVLVCILLYIQCNRDLSERFEAILPGSTPNSSAFLSHSKPSPYTTESVHYIPNSSVVPNSTPRMMANRDSGCGSQGFVASNLLPKNNKALDDTAFDFAPKDLQNINFLDATTRIGVDTVSSSLRNANYQLRSEPPNPRDAVSPWMNSTIDPDLERKSLET